jgi:hypothetical protein
VHDAKVVVVEQREVPRRVQIRDLATGAPMTALIAAFRARSSGAEYGLTRMACDTNATVAGREPEQKLRRRREPFVAAWPGTC